LAGSTQPSATALAAASTSFFELGERLALDGLHPIGFIVWGNEPAPSVIEESPLAVHKPVERGRIRLLVKEVDAVVTNS
jgi:hypothetical protein